MPVPFISRAPLPQMYPSCISPEKAGLVQKFMFAGTTSVCCNNIKAGLFPPLILAQIFPLPGALSAELNSMPSFLNIFA